MFIRSSKAFGGRSPVGISIRMPRGPWAKQRCLWDDWASPKLWDPHFEDPITQVFVGQYSGEVMSNSFLNSFFQDAERNLSPFAKYLLSSKDQLKPMCTKSCPLWLWLVEVGCRLRCPHSTVP